MFPWYHLRIISLDVNDKMALEALYDRKTKSVPNITKQSQNEPQYHHQHHLLHKKNQYK